MNVRNLPESSPAFGEPLAFAIAPVCLPIESTTLQLPCVIILKSRSDRRDDLSNPLHPIDNLHRNARMPFQNP